MRFIDRRDAGGRLAKRLSRFAVRPETVVVALPRGGVVVGREVADALRLPFDIVVTRKIGAEQNPEYAIGAIGEAGEAVWNDREHRDADPAYVEAEVARQREEAARRLRTYRVGLPPRDFAGKTILLVDDGVATGYTMRAAIADLRRARPAAIVAAVPVCPPDSLAAIAAEADEVVVLETPEDFDAIGRFYQEFAQVGDDAVIAALRRA
jgi:predicted phosphoribosyltransferase